VKRAGELDDLQGSDTTIQMEQSKEVMAVILVERLETNQVVSG